MNNDETQPEAEAESHKEYADRRVRPARPDAKGMVHTDTYDGPDRRAYRKRQKEAIRKEKIKFLNRTTLSVGALGGAALYAIVFLLAPEMKDINDNAERVREMTARMDALNKEVAAQRGDKSVSLGNQLSREIGGAQDAIDSATGKVKDVAAAVAAVAAPAAGVEDLLQMLSGVQTLGRTKSGSAALAKAIAKLRAAVGVAGSDPANINAAISIVRKQDPTLGVLFGNIDDNHLGAAALLLSLDDLRRRIARQQPFGDDIILAATIAGNDPAIKTALAGLLPYADTGIAGKGALAQQLVDLSSTIVTAEAPPSDGTLKAEALQRLSQYVRIHKAGDVQGKGPEAAVARARLDINNGDMHAALTEMQALQGPSAVAAAPWVAAAKGYVAAEESSDILTQTIQQTLLAAASGGGFSLEGMVNTLKTNFAAPLEESGGIMPGGQSADVPYVSPAMLHHDDDSKSKLPSFNEGH
jgi:hypothetical protein